jgi:hypothetical protein
VWQSWPDIDLANGTIDINALAYFPGAVMLRSRSRRIFGTAAPSQAAVAYTVEGSVACLLMRESSLALVWTCGRLRCCCLGAGDHRGAMTPLIAHRCVAPVICLIHIASKSRCSSQLLHVSIRYIV